MQYNYNINIINRVLWFKWHKQMFYYVGKILNNNFNNVSSLDNC